MIMKIKPIACGKCEALDVLKVGTRYASGHYCGRCKTYTDKSGAIFKVYGVLSRPGGALLKKHLILRKPSKHSSQLEKPIVVIRRGNDQKDRSQSACG